MTQLTFIKHQSWSKIGTITGLVSGHLFSNGNRFVGDLLGVIGTAVGAFISMPTQQTIIDANVKQIEILKDHFLQSVLEKLNPIETNYELYKRDCIGDTFSWLKSIKNIIWSKFTITEQETCYRNKVISEKYIVLDIFHDTDIKSIVLDLAPLGMIGGFNTWNSKSVLAAVVDTAIIYGSKIALNYILYTQDNLHDYERIELEFNKDEIPLFEEYLPTELAAEVIRVAA